MTFVETPASAAILEASDTSGSPPSAPSRRELAGKIQALADDGLSIAEIGRQLGISRQRVLKISGQFRLRLQRPGPRRRVLAEISATHFVILSKLAADACVGQAEMAARLIRSVLAEGAARAAEWLGKDALPLRPYHRRSRG